MEVLEAIKKRRSVRKFDSSKPVSDEQIKELLEAAQWAPSAGNLQSRFFVVVRDSEAKNQLAKAAFGQGFIAEAPAVIVFCADLEISASKYSDRGRELYCIQDATLAAQNFWLAATDVGLGAGWVGSFDESEVSRVLALQEHFYPIAIMPLGYPDESPEPPPRRPVKDISKII